MGRCLRPSKLEGMLTQSSFDYEYSLATLPPEWELVWGGGAGDAGTALGKEPTVADGDNSD